MFSQLDVVGPHSGDQRRTKLLIVTGGLKAEGERNVETVGLLQTARHLPLKCNRWQPKFDARQRHRSACRGAFCCSHRCRGFYVPKYDRHRQRRGVRREIADVHHHQRAAGAQRCRRTYRFNHRLRTIVEFERGRNCVSPIHHPQGRALNLIEDGLHVANTVSFCAVCYIKSVTWTCDPTP